MKVSTYLEAHQKVVMQSLTSSFTNGRVSHAYLLLGEPGVPLKQTAYFIAKSILCEHASPLADETCLTCERIDHDSYSDLLFLDGSSTTIKKDDVENVIASFSKTAIERKGIMIYIINLVENMTTDAVNSLLKFLEEPSTKTYAILTSENESKILPTIISRCECLRMHLEPSEEIIAEAEALEVPLEDAELLAHFLNSAELIKEEVATDEYLEAKSAFKQALLALATTRDGCLYGFEANVLPILDKRDSGKSSLDDKKNRTRTFLDMLSLVYLDIIALKYGQKPKLTSYGKLVKLIAERTHHPEKLLRLILLLRGDVDLNINTALLLDHLAIKLTEEY